MVGRILKPLIIGFCVSLSFLASAPTRASTETLTPNFKNVLPTRLSANPLIVVHASTEFDDQQMAKPGIDAQVAKSKAENRSVVYLVSDPSPEGYDLWYTRDRSPDYELFSEGGEHNLPLETDEVTIVGGFFGSYDGARGCHTLGTRDAIRMHFEKSNRPFTIHMPLQAIYFYEEDERFREKLLNLNVAATSTGGIRKLFDRFAESFFLTDNFAEPLEFSHPYFARMNQDYRFGEPVNVDRYTFHILMNDRPVAEPFGHGPRQVYLKLENGK